MDNSYLQGIGAFANIIGDYAYDTNNYALNFSFQPILPGIGNRDFILNNNIVHEYLPIDDVSGGEVLKDTFGNTLNVGSMTGYNPYAMAATALVTIGGKIKKQFDINKENERGRLLTNISNQQLPIVNNYAMGLTNLLNRFYHSSEGGGNLNTHGATFDNGMTYFNVGGTHGLNPYGGILQGFNQEDGEPNLVELGETKWNDYIFSNRYKVGGSLLKKYLLPEEYAGMTFADISKKLSEPLEDTPGSMIEKRTTDTMLSRLMEALEEKRAKDTENKINGYMFATGGKKKRTPVETITANPRTINLLDNPYNQEIDYLPRTLVSQYIEPYDNSQDFIGPETEGEWLYNHPEKPKFNFNPRYLTLLDNFASVLGDKLGITNQPDYGRSRMIRDAASNITNTGITTPYLQRYIPKEIPIQSLMNNYRSMFAADIARANNTTNANIVAAQALANNATNKYYDSLGQALIDATQYNNQENARASQINNASELQLAQLLQNNSQFNAQQGIHRYRALKDYIDDLSMQDQLASAAQQGNLNTWREGLQNYLMEREDKDVIAKLINSGALRYDKNSGAFYLDNDYLSQYV